MISAYEFSLRRKNLFEKIDDNSITILFSGVAKKSSADEDYPFLGNRNFYYLTNIEQENSIYVLIKSDGLMKEFLFIQPRDELKEKWTGRRLTIEEATNLSGIENVLIVDSFDSKLDLILNRREKVYGDIKTLYLDFDGEQKISKDKDIDDFSYGLKNNYPYLNIKDVYQSIIELRMVKSQAEIDEFIEAITKTNIGLKKIMKTLKPNLYEYQLAALFFYTIQDYDFAPLSFPTIAASGKNATCLHYTSLKSKLNNDDLILFDLGGKNNGYCADISRTYPVSGKFSSLQKKIYSIVLGCNKYIISKIRPGITLKELNNLTVEFLANECLKEGLIKEKEDIKKYYFHSISHHIGLDTHDPSLREKPLQKGNIISCEPGLYFEEYGIGVRIEDDILVTEEGSYNLSGNIIKEVDDIEKAMKYSEF